ncbi:STAS domain-containing protein [Actinomadura fibrosa]|uniref:Anti-sigma factor antagonist n=1 Tax=Actinomadura fibrosa TaxID=111802 RepID=A0ABW2XZH3_9ACTN|nr:STAS domain-containing protein [Actinomadura fibrosa]
MTTLPPLAISGVLDDEVLVVRLAGDLDVATAPRLRAYLLETLDDRRPGTLVLEMSAVEFTDSSGLATLVWAHGEMARGGGALEIRNPRPTLRRIMAVSGLSSRLTLTPAERNSGLRNRNHDGDGSRP